MIYTLYNNYIALDSVIIIRLSIVTERANFSRE